MGISSTNRQVAVVAASLVAAAWLTVAPLPAQATPEGAPQSYSQAAATTGVCGWFSQEFSDRFETVNVCGYDGVAVRDGAPERLAEPLVVIDTYSCFFHKSDCAGEHHEVLVDRGDFVVDPLLRQARITTTAAGCGVEVEFVGMSAATPSGGAWEYHGLEGGPSVSASGDQTLARPAQWWGRVCGRFLVADPGEGQMWRNLSAGAGRYPVGREGAVEA